MKKNTNRKNYTSVIGENTDKSFSPLVIIDPKGLKAIKETWSAKFSSQKIEIIDPFRVSEGTNKRGSMGEAAAIADQLEGRDRR